MKVCGIIVEYNPFHNGHIHHIEQAKKISQCDILIAIMSPTFMQRGEPAIINKFIRTKTALDYGVDILIELPSIYAVSSANYFAQGALQLLNEMKVNQIVFGSESNDITKLQDLAQFSCSNKYQEKLKEFQKTGQRYATSCNKAFEYYNYDIVNQANDILALAYLQEIIKHDYQITPYTIQRTNDFLSDDIDSTIASATAIRSNIETNKQDITKTSPLALTLLKSNELVYLNDFFHLLKYQLNILSHNQLTRIQGIDEGLEYLFKKHIIQSNTMDEFINATTSKRYPKTRIQRTIFYILANITKQDIINIKVDYLRILGMNTKGQQYLKQIKHQTEYHIITRFSAYKSPALDLEQKVTFLYTQANKNIDYLNKKEYQQPVIIKSEN